MRRQKLKDSWDGYEVEYEIKEDLNLYEVEYMESWSSYISENGLEDWEILLVRN